MLFRSPRGIHIGKHMMMTIRDWIPGGKHDDQVDSTTQAIEHRGRPVSIYDRVVSADQSHLYA